MVTRRITSVYSITFIEIAMDEDVRKSLARWPNVPAAYGWLSLSPRGEWRFHPGGGAYSGGPGEPIGNTRIQAFMSRNYTHDDAGRWFFQNGPQRVYVRVDAAPLIVRRTADARLLTHTGAAFGPVTHWVIDDMGRLYAQSAVGPGTIDDRDLAATCESLLLEDGAPAIDAIADLAVGQGMRLRQTHAGPLVDITCVTEALVPTTLAFIRQPEASAQNTPTLR